MKPGQLKQKSQDPISQTGKIQMNTKVNKEKPGTTFKIPSTTKLPIRIKQCNAQGSTKPLRRTYSIESMDSDTGHIVASLKFEEILNNYNTWNHLTLDVNLFYTELNCLRWNCFWMLSCIISKRTDFDIETILTLNWIFWNGTVLAFNYVQKKYILTLNRIGLIKTVWLNWIAWNRNVFVN